MIEEIEMGGAFLEIEQMGLGKYSIEHVNSSSPYFDIDFGNEVIRYYITRKQERNIWDVLESIQGNKEKMMYLDAVARSLETKRRSTLG